MNGFFQRISPTQKEFEAAIAATAAMVQNPEAQALAARRGLQVLDLTWEDTARFKGSSVGPNISDLTIQVQQGAGSKESRCMPVIRAPNFSDRSADLSLDHLFLRVGNERGETLRTVSLREYLGDLRRFLHCPSSWAGGTTSLLAPRDSHVLLSAQACFLPVPRSGIAQFNPVLFNYQSQVGAPAVLCLVVTREGTSATVIENGRDGVFAGRARGQQLFFNQAGQRASFTGQRESDFRAAEAASGRAIDESGPSLNLAMIIQVPLVRPEPPPFAFDLVECAAALSAAPRGMFGGSSEVEEAVLGHGEIEGPFTEIAGLPIERDDRFPIRVTAQYYQATSKGVVSRSDVDAIADAIERTYADARAVGSLVTEGPTSRPTESAPAPRRWWNSLWGS